MAITLGSFMPFLEKHIIRGVFVNSGLISRILALWLLVPDVISIKGYFAKKKKRESLAMKTAHPNIHIAGFIVNIS